MASRHDIEAMCEASIDEVYRYALRLCGGDAHRTADLVQDTYSTFLAHVDRVPDDEIGVGWLITCCRHRHLDHFRTSQRRSFYERRAWSPQTAPDIHDRVGEAVMALAQIDEPGRTALVLRYVDGYAIADVASAISRSVAATDSILRRARARLTEAYEQLTEAGEVS